MNTLTLQAGSSSLELSLLEAERERTLADGGVGWVQKPARLSIRRGEHAAAPEGLAGAHEKESLGNVQTECQSCAYEQGAGKPQIDKWSWTGLDHSAGAAK
jgi:acetate kinase